MKYFSFAALAYSGLAALALMVASPVVASPTPPYNIIWNPQSTALPGYTTATVLEDFSTPDVPNNTPFVGQTVAGLFTDYADVPANHDPRTSVFETPLSGMDGQYIGVVKGADYTIELLSGGVQFFSFVFNGLGTDDKLTLYFGDGTSQTIIGHDILTGGAVIDLQNTDIPAPPNDWGRVSYDMLGGPPIVKAVFSSGAGTWFIDSIAFAAPEPGTWLMMILGFGLAGWQLRFRRRKAQLATA